METMFQWLVLTLCLSLLFLVGVGIVFWFALRMSRPNVLTVTEGEDKKMGGLPFYLKRGRRIRETVYLETLADVTLTLMKTTPAADGKETSATVMAAKRTISLSGEDVSGKLSALQAKVAEAQGSNDPAKLWNDTKADFEALPEYTGVLPAALPVVLNAVREESYVDYENRYFINATMPLIGSTELGAKLAADGTLSEATSKTEDSTLTTLLGALPTADLVGLLKPKEAGETPPDDETPPKRPVRPRDTATARFDLQLTVERHYVRHWLSEPADVQRNPPRIPLDQADSVSYRREMGTEPRPAAPAAPPTTPAPQPKKEEEAPAT